MKYVCVLSRQTMYRDSETTPPSNTDSILKAGRCNDETGCRIRNLTSKLYNGTMRLLSWWSSTVLTILLQSPSPICASKRCRNKALERHKS